MTQQTIGSSRDDADRHDLRLLRSRQRARPVLYQGTMRFIAGLCLHKGDSEMVVYLTGSAEPVKPSELTIVEPPT